LALIHDAIMPKWGTLVKVPQPHPELCSKHLLVMECLDGVKLVDGIRAQYAKVRVAAVVLVCEVIFILFFFLLLFIFGLIIQVAAATGTTVEAMEEERKEGIRLGEAINYLRSFWKPFASYRDCKSNISNQAVLMILRFAGNFAFQTLEESRKERAWMEWYCAVNDFLFNPVNLAKLCYNYSILR
jgi:predicted membrane-bound dolichyl-phosphate-mannose-protein mannosyltransferase